MPGFGRVEVRWRYGSAGPLKRRRAAADLGAGSRPGWGSPVLRLGWPGDALPWAAADLGAGFSVGLGPLAIRLGWPAEAPPGEAPPGRRRPGCRVSAGL